jgi:hypothetical protein
MPPKIYFKRGTTDKVVVYVGQQGEAVLDIGLKTLRIQDGATPGGNLLADRKFVTDSVADAVQGLDTKVACRVATTGNLTASYANKTLTNTGTLAPLTIDTILLAVNERVLVKNQTNVTQNGIFRVLNPGSASVPWTLVRDIDADISSELPSGTYTFVTEGAVNASIGFSLSTKNPITLDTTPLEFTQFSGAGQIDAGDGLTKTGNRLNIATGSASRIAVGENAIDLATTGVTAGEYRILTVDAYGRTIAAKNPSTLADFGSVPTASLGAATNEVASCAFVQQELSIIDGGVM